MLTSCDLCCEWAKDGAAASNLRLLCHTCDCSVLLPTHTAAPGLQGRAARAGGDACAAARPGGRAERVCGRADRPAQVRGAQLRGLHQGGQEAQPAPARRGRPGRGRAAAARGGPAEPAILLHLAQAGRAGHACRGAAAGARPARSAARHLPPGLERLGREGQQTTPMHPGAVNAVVVPGQS